MVRMARQQRVFAICSARNDRRRRLEIALKWFNVSVCRFDPSRYSSLFRRETFLNRLCNILDGSVLTQGHDVLIVRDLLQTHLFRDLPVHA